MSLDLHNIELSLIDHGGFEEIVGNSSESIHVGVRAAFGPTKSVFVDFRCHRVCVVVRYRREAAIL